MSDVWLVTSGFYISVNGIYSTEAFARAQADQINARELQGMLEWNQEHPEAAYQEDEMRDSREKAVVTRWELDKGPVPTP